MLDSTTSLRRQKEEGRRVADFAADAADVFSVKKEEGRGKK
ncbi:MAG: hypothetical protein ACRC62_11685 [Microcoleus sp.]